MVIAIFYLALLVKQILTLSRALQDKKSEEEWTKLFTMCGSTVVCTIIVFAFINTTLYQDINVLKYFALNIMSIMVFVIMTLISIILKLVYNYKNKETRVKDFDSKRNILYTTAIVVSLFASALIVNNAIYMGKEKIIEVHDNGIKENELTKMTDYLKKKYNKSITNDNCIYYQKEDYSEAKDFMGIGYNKKNQPYIGIFRTNKDTITVVDRKGIISDDYQIKEINILMANYFSKITGQSIEFVQIRQSGNGNIFDSTMNYYIQNDFNQLVTVKNINSFIDGLLRKKDVSILFYLKTTNDRKYVISNLTKSLSYLKDYKELRQVSINFYDESENLIINDYTNRKETSSDSYEFLDDSIFDYYYIPTKSDSKNNEAYNKFVCAVDYNLNRGYGGGHGQYDYDSYQLGNWVVYDYK